MNVVDARCYAAGSLAYMNGVSDDDCPYASAWKTGGPFNEERYSWMLGWTEARSRSRLKKTYPRAFRQEKS